MHAQFRRNYGFFDAPVGLIFTIDRIMRQGSWLDYGMFVQNVMVAARARGLDTCPQVAFLLPPLLVPGQCCAAASALNGPTRRASPTPRTSPPRRIP